MEVRIYDKNGDVIAEDHNNDGNDASGHYDIHLSELKSEIKFIPIKEKGKKEKDSESDS